MKMHKSYYGCAVTAVLLAVLMGLNQTHLTPGDAAGYHEHVRKTVLAIPHQLGPWKGKDQEVVKEAVELLRPNVMLSRTYTHEETGESVTLLIVQCKDARDLLAHYPPICYPNAGWKIEKKYKPVNKLFNHREKKNNWAVYPMYHKSSQANEVSQIVYQKMPLPNGTVTKDMGEVRAFAGNYLVRHFGASQVQIIVQESLRGTTKASIDPILDAIEPFLEAVVTDTDSLN